MKKYGGRPGWLGQTGRISVGPFLNNFQNKKTFKAAASTAAHILVVSFN